ncbi:unnamed protein product, partial [Cladocopium goreaui]
MAHDRGSLLYDLSQLLRLGQSGYANLKEGVSSLWSLIAQQRDQHTAVELLQKLQAVAEEFSKTQVAKKEASTEGKTQAKDAKASSSADQADAGEAAVRNGAMLRNGEGPGESSSSANQQKWIKKKTEGNK